jgi:hypothetical protein
MKNTWLTLAGLPLAALAHDGHGLSGSHWHPADVLGFVVLALVAAATVWWSLRK